MGKDIEYIPVHLVKDGGEQKQDAYSKINPSQVSPLFFWQVSSLLKSLFYPQFPVYDIWANLYLLSVVGSHSHYEGQDLNQEANITCGIDGHLWIPRRGLSKQEEITS